MTSRYDPQDYEEDDIPEDGTRQLEDTPPRARPPVRQTGAYDRPAVPRDTPRNAPRDTRQERQAAPMRQPPPAPPVMPPEYAPNTDYPAAPRRKRQTPPPPPPRRAEANPKRKNSKNKSESGWYLPWWSLIVLLVFVGGAAIGAWAVFDSVGGNTPPGGQTPIVVVVTATYTAGPPPTLTPLPQVQATVAPALPTIVVTATLPPGDFRAGVTVQVVGVGITGLNIRRGPGVESEILFVAAENSRWVIKSGPQNASGVEWWEVQDPNNPSTGGWASRNYLTVVSQ